MPYPTKYDRQYDFQSYQVSNPTRPLPGNQVNTDLNAVKQSVGEIIDFLKGPIRSDGRLANGSVGVDQLNPNLNLGFSLPTVWAPRVDYTDDSTVLYANKFWKSKGAHTSTDGFDESRWDLIVDFGEQATSAAESAAAATASKDAAAASAVSTAADRVQTGQDAAATAADRVQTGQDAAATAADRVQTGLDVVQTGSDRMAAAASAAAAAASAEEVADVMHGADNLSEVGDPAAALANLGSSPSFDTKALASAFPWNTAPEHIRVAGYAVAGDGGAALYVKALSEPTHDEKFYITLADGVTVVWYGLSESNPRPETAGGVGDGSTDDTAALAALLAYAGSGFTIDLRGKAYKYTTLHITKDVVIRNGSLLCDATTGVQITVDPSARFTARNVKFTGGGSHTTADTNLNHSIISQIGASTSSRGVGLDLEGCEFSGCGYVSVFSKFCDGHRFVNNKFTDFAYAGFMVLSCDGGVARENRVEGQDAVGVDGDAYGFSVTHWSAGYDTDPNAGTPLAANPFSNNWQIIGNTVIAPKKWEGIDFHGGYNNVVAFNKVYGAQIGILLGTGSGSAANYAGWNNIITCNTILATNEDGTAVSGLLSAYGIVVNGGSSASHKRVIVTNNVIDGYGGNYAVTVPAIRVDGYVDDFVISGNVINNWSGSGISIAEGAGSGVINDNMFSGMRDTQASSAAIRFQSDAPGRYSILGNVLADIGGNAPAIGLVTSGSVKGRITYGSDFRRAATEVAATFTSPGELRQISYV